MLVWLLLTRPLETSVTTGCSPPARRSPPAAPLPPSARPLCPAPLFRTPAAPPRARAPRPARRRGCQAPPQRWRRRASTPTPPTPHPTPRNPPPCLRPANITPYNGGEVRKFSRRWRRPTHSCLDHAQTRAGKGGASLPASGPNQHGPVNPQSQGGRMVRERAASLQ